MMRRQRRSRRRRDCAVEDSLEVRGDRHRCDRADVGAAGVAERVATDDGPGPGDEEADELSDDLAAVPLAYPFAPYVGVG